MMFSVNRKSDGSKKDTLINIEDTRECAINMVSYGMPRQMDIGAFGFDYKTKKHFNWFQQFPCKYIAKQDPHWK